MRNKLIPATLAMVTGIASVCTPASASELKSADQFVNTVSDKDDQKTEETVNILFVGDKHTHDGTTGYGVDTIFEDIAKKEGKKVTVQTVAHDDATLNMYAEKTEGYEAYFKEFKNALNDEEWDYVVLQDNIYDVIHETDTLYYPAVRKLKEKINDADEDARVLLYATNVEETPVVEEETPTETPEADTVVDETTVKELTQTEKDLQCVIAANNRIASELEIDVVKIGSLFAYAGKVNSDVKLIRDDLKYPTWAGYYLAASAFYNNIYGLYPETDTTIKGCNISQEHLDILNKASDADFKVTGKNDTMVYGDKKELSVEEKRPISTESDKIYWYSLSNKVSVDRISGEVTATGVGVADVVAVSENGQVCAQAIKVNPAGTQLAEVTPGIKDVNVTWTEQLELMNTTSVDGYQIRYSIEDNMANAVKINIDGAETNEKKIEELYSETNYYFQIRTYKEVEGTKYYSSWSKKEHVETEIDPDRATNILFIGNSYTHHGKNKSMPTLVEELAAMNGRKVNSYLCVEGGSYIKYFAGKYAGKVTKMLSGPVKYDYVVIQGNGRTGDMIPAVRSIKAKVEKYQPNAKVYLYSTQPANINNYANNNTRYKATANATGTGVILAASVAAKCREKYPGIRLRSTMAEDGHHPTFAGYWVAACSVYNVFFGDIDKVTTQLTGNNLSLDNLWKIARLANETL